MIGFIDRESVGSGDNLLPIVRILYGGFRDLSTYSILKLLSWERTHPACLEVPIYAIF